jgi:hypothetical protein
MFHNSNFFFRDLQYGVRRFLEKKGTRHTTADAGILAENIAKFFEDKGIFVRINDFSWRLDYPEFVTQVPGDPL